jgi:hypothetical protein
LKLSKTRCFSDSICRVQVDVNRCWRCLLIRGSWVRFPPRSPKNPFRNKHFLQTRRRPSSHGLQMGRLWDDAQSRAPSLPSLLPPAVARLVDGLAPRLWRVWGLGGGPLRLPASLGAVGPPAGLPAACQALPCLVAPRSPWRCRLAVRALWGHASRSEGCRYGRIRGLPGRDDGKIDREPVILGMHRRQLGQSRPMARGAAIRRHADVSDHDRASPIIFNTASPSKP